MRKINKTPMPILENEKQQTPMPKEVEPKDASIKATVIANRLSSIYSLENVDSDINPKK